MTDVDVSPSRDHGWYRIDANRFDRASTAVCECGWRSTAFHTVGLAGAAWNIHVDDLDHDPAGASCRPTTDGPASVSPPYVTLALEGRQVHAEDPGFRAFLAELIEAMPGWRIELEMSVVTFLDSSFLATLVGSCKVARAHGGDLRIIHPSAEVRAVLDVTGTASIFVPDTAIGTAARTPRR